MCLPCFWHSSVRHPTVGFHATFPLQRSERHTHSCPVKQAKAGHHLVKHQPELRPQCGILNCAAASQRSHWVLRVFLRSCAHDRLDRCSANLHPHLHIGQNIPTSLRKRWRLRRDVRRTQDTCLRCKADALAVGNYQQKIPDLLRSRQEAGSATMTETFRR